MARALVAAVERQLARRDELLRAGARQIGWKLGIGDTESIGGEIAVGFLTTATQLKPGATFSAADSKLLHADAEIAVELGVDVQQDADEAAVAAAIRGFRPALEIVDLPGNGDAEEAIAGNVFHRAIALGGLKPHLPEGLEVRLLVGGEARRGAPAPANVAPRLAAGARILGAAGERMRAGDVIITGNVVQVAIVPGDEVVADLGALGAVGLRIGL